MPHKTPDFVTAVIGCIAAAFGGIARWHEAGLFNKPFNVCLFVFDMFMSAIAGVGIYWLVWDLGQPDSVCAMAAAITGNVGARIFDIVRFVFKKRTGIELPEEGKDEDRKF